MKVELLNKDESKTNFIIKDIDANLANTLRRTIMEEVTVMAVDEVNFIKNQSALYDEIIAHRLGLIPLKTDLKSYNLSNNCKCKDKGCASCQTTLTIKAVGPGTVYAKELKSKDPKIQPVFPNMPIVSLLKDQVLEGEMTASLGFGKTHSKYAPALVYYRNYPEIKIKDSKAVAGKEVCPVNVFKVENGKIKVDDEKKCILCNACVDETNGDIEVNTKENEFIFFIESWGQLSCREIINKAFDVLDEKLDDFGKQVGKL